ncbi:MAG TPA: thymidine kinase [Hyphomonadaceae bacterium]|jgi:thymidine kinase|nr:thymidine kinase [Hyphomonadaceae bacterium]
MSKLYFSYAAMNAGKSTVLLQASWNYQERGMRTLLFTSALYATQDDGRITSRIGIAADATLYNQTDDLQARITREHKKKRVDCVFVDEAQFLTKEQVWQLARVSDRLGIPVLCYGLRTDFRGELFPGSAELLAIADSLREIRTICHCGRKATMVVRRTADGKALTSGAQVGIEKSMYLSLCRAHWEEETGRWPVAKPKAKAKTKAAAKPVAKKKPAKKAQLRLAAANTPRAARRVKR